MRIKCLTDFKDGTDQFNQDDQVTVDDARAAGFIAQGWAVSVDPNATPAEVNPAATVVDLEIDSITHKTEAQNG